MSDSPTFVYVLTSQTFNKIVGAYLDQKIANIIAMSNNCVIDRVRIDGLYPGYLDSIKHIFNDNIHESVDNSTYIDDMVVVRVPSKVR